MKDMISMDGGDIGTKNAAEKTPSQGKKKEFKLRMLIPPGQKVPVGIAS